MIAMDECRAIVLEGVDEVGKSTLAAALQAKLGNHWRVVHTTAPPKTASPRQIADQYLTTVMATPYAIYDRLHLGEVVYGPVRRQRPAAVSWPWLRLVELALLSDGAMLVYVAPPRDAEDRWRRAGESFDEQYRLHLEYRAQLRQTWLPVLIVQMDMPDETIAVADRIAYLRRRLVALPSAWRLGELVGSPWAEWLLLGERRNGRDGPGIPFRGPTGPVILRAVDQPVLLANSQPLGGQLAIAAQDACIDAWLRRRGFHGVVPLGHVAEKMLAERSWRHDRRLTIAKRVPHPAYWRRFRSTESYRTRLEQVMAAARGPQRWRSTKP